MLEKIETWLPSIALAGALIAACSSNAAHEKSGRGGSGGSAAGGRNAGQAGSSGPVGANAGNGGAGGQAGSSAGSAGASTAGSGGSPSAGNAGSSSAGSGGGAGPSAGGAAGTSASRGGSTGAVGQAGSGGSAGAVGGSGGGPPGTLEVDLWVTVGTQSTRVTKCMPDTVYDYSNRLTTYQNGNHVGTMYCKPEPSAGALAVRHLSIQTFPQAVGMHAASELGISCDLAAGGCSGVGSVQITVTTDASNLPEISSLSADAKSGTFELNEFTADGHVLGNMDLTMTKGAYTVRITGRFTAALHDCGLMGSATFDPCTGRTG